MKVVQIKIIQNPFLQKNKKKNNPKPQLKPPVGWLKLCDDLICATEVRILLSVSEYFVNLCIVDIY